MIEQQLEQGRSAPFYEAFMTDKEREIFKDFLSFEPDKKPGARIEHIAAESFPTKETDGEQLEGLETGLALARELDAYQAEYMDPRLYTHWSDTDIGGPNCMAFAIDRPWLDSAGRIPYDTKPYPGYFCGEGNPIDLCSTLRSGDFEGSKEKFEYLLSTDLTMMGKNLVEVDKDYVCVDGERKICMMGSSLLGDFHFMREGENAWFHKPGLTSVSCFDDSGHLIVDPARCNTIYDMFYGYYVIRDKGEE